MTIASVLPAIMDIEASGFGGESYPIEIGVVLSNGQRFCRLIRPFEDWDYWDTKAEQIHGISREQLKKSAFHGTQVCHELNQFLNGKTVYSDAWVVDNPWLIKLFHRSGVQMSFKLSSIELILSESQLKTWDKDKAFIMRRSGLQRHRASTDACIIQLTYERSFSRTLNTR